VAAGCDPEHGYRVAHLTATVSVPAAAMALTLTLRV
jgi:hypothetical protein